MPGSDFLSQQSKRFGLPVGGSDGIGQRHVMLVRGYGFDEFFGRGGRFTGTRILFAGRILKQVDAVARRLDSESRPRAHRLPQKQAQGRQQRPNDAREIRVWRQLSAHKMLKIRQNAGKFP